MDVDKAKTRQNSFLRKFVQIANLIEKIPQKMRKDIWQLLVRVRGPQDILQKSRSVEAS